MTYQEVEPDLCVLAKLDLGSYFPTLIEQAQDHQKPWACTSALSRQPGSHLLRVPSPRPMWQTAHQNRTPPRFHQGCRTDFRQPSTGLLTGERWLKASLDKYFQ